MKNENFVLPRLALETLWQFQTQQCLPIMTSFHDELLNNEQKKHDDQQNN